MWSSPGHGAPRRRAVQAHSIAPTRTVPSTCGIRRPGIRTVALQDRPGSGANPVASRRKARSTSPTRSSLSARAQQAKAAMAAPSAARATVWGPRSSGRPPEPRRGEGGHHVAPLLVADGGVGHQGRDRADEDHPDPQLVELAGPEAVGGDHRSAEHVHHRLGLGGLGQPVAQPAQLGVELPPDHVGLGLEVAEERPAGDPDRRRRSRRPSSRRIPGGRRGRVRPGRRPGATCWPDGPGSAPTQAPPPLVIGPAGSSRFHFGIECTKLHPLTRSRLRAGRPTEEP